MRTTNVKKEYEESFGIFSKKDIQECFDILEKEGYLHKIKHSDEYIIDDYKIQQMIQEIEKMN